jgi:hypothetical protein
LLPSVLCRTLGLQTAPRVKITHITPSVHNLLFRFCAAVFTSYYAYYILFPCMHIAVEILQLYYCFFLVKINYFYFVVSHCNSISILLMLLQQKIRFAVSKNIVSCIFSLNKTVNCFSKSYLKHDRPIYFYNPSARHLYRNLSLG